MELVLLGIGHTNAEILRRWARDPLPGSKLTCVSDAPVATYSGMLPGVLAGQYSFDEMQIDLRRLCETANAELILSPIGRVDLHHNTMDFDDRPSVPFDVLSVGVGSRPSEVADDGAPVVSIKPMRTFMHRVRNSTAIGVDRTAGAKLRIGVIGAGPGGFEIACCLPHFLEHGLGVAEYEVTLIDRSDAIVNALPGRTQALATTELERQLVRTELGRDLIQVSDDGVASFSSGPSLQFDLIISATSAQAPQVLDQFELPKDDRGFLLTRSTLQSVGSDSVFAVGDAGTLQGRSVAKAGVHAVRQGPVLWDNLMRIQSGAALRQWRPQPSFLSLLNTGDGRVIMTYKKLSFHSRWCWHLKNAIDRRFVRKYQVP